MMDYHFTYESDHLGEGDVCAIICVTIYCAITKVAHPGGGFSIELDGWRVAQARSIDNKCLMNQVVTSADVMREINREIKHHRDRILEKAI